MNHFALPLALLDGVDPWIFAFSFVTVVATRPLTKDDLHKAIEHFRKEAKKLPENGTAAAAPAEA